MSILHCEKFSVFVLHIPLTLSGTSQIAGIVVALVNAAYLHDQNRRKKENREALLEKYDTSKQADGGVQAWVDLGDRHPDFPYML